MLYWSLGLSRKLYMNDQSEILDFVSDSGRKETGASAVVRGLLGG